MKKLFLLLLLTQTSTFVFAQDDKQEADNNKSEEQPKGFQKDKLFTGGTLNVSFYNNTTVLGLSPFFGYSLNKFVDVAVSLNWSYISQRNSIDASKIRQAIVGPGAFIRLFPVNFLFAQAQYEKSFIKYKYIPGTSGGLTEIYTLKANSLLVGGGFCQGRDGHSNSYYYMSILWDIGKDKNSPYVDAQNRAVPIIRAGYNFSLFQGKKWGK